jgi:hypothetical protein
MPAVGLLLLMQAAALAHPFPELPVRANFLPDGGCEVRVQVDPRCFGEDPNVGPYLLRSEWESLPSEEKDGMIQKASGLVHAWVEFSFEPGLPVRPDFQFTFTTPEGGDLKNADDPVAMSGVWKTRVPPGATGWSIRATALPKVAVVLHNEREGRPLKRFAVLFPEEKSFVLDLAALTSMPLADEADLAAAKARNEHPEDEDEAAPSVIAEPANEGISKRVWWPLLAVVAAGIWWMMRRHENAAPRE